MRRSLPSSEERRGLSLADAHVQIRAAERAGLSEIGLLPPMAAARTVLREFAEGVIARY